MDQPHECASIQGQLLRRSERREVAIYLRDGQLWIADFIDGVGALMEQRRLVPLQLRNAVGAARAAKDALRIGSPAVRRSRVEDRGVAPRLFPAGRRPRQAALNVAHCCESHARVTAYCKSVEFCQGMP
jgi:hypothetical protein